MIIHARFDSVCHVFGKSVGGHGYNWHMCDIPSLEGTNLPGRLITVHDRHLDIHQYYLVKSFFRLGDFMYGVEPIYRRIDSDTGAADDLYGDLTI